MGLMNSRLVFRSSNPSLLPILPSWRSGEDFQGPLKLHFQGPNSRRKFIAWTLDSITAILNDCFCDCGIVLVDKKNRTIISKSCFRQNMFNEVADIAQFDLVNLRTFKDLSCFQGLE